MKWRRKNVERETEKMGDKQREKKERKGKKREGEEAEEEEMDKTITIYNKNIQHSRTHSHIQP